jgi:adenosylcobinamide-phosphate guanylyltransferase
MCGGRGTRLDRGEKPLVRVGGDPMLDRVVAACRESAAGTVHAVVSPHAPATRERALGLGLPVVDAPGEGYVADLDHALDSVGRPALTVAADLPLLPAAAVDRTLAACGGGGDGTGGGDGPVAGANAGGAAAGSDAGASTPSVAVYVPAALKRRLGASRGTTTRTGDGEERGDGEPGPGTGSGSDADTGRDGDRGRELAPTGLNVAGTGPDRTLVSWDARLAVNVNRPSDLALAEALS